MNSTRPQPDTGLPGIAMVIALCMGACVSGAVACAIILWIGVTL